LNDTECTLPTNKAFGKLSLGIGKKLDEMLVEICTEVVGGGSWMETKTGSEAKATKCSDG